MRTTTTSCSLPIPTEVDDETRNLGYNGLQHIAMEVKDRDEWLKALADLRRKGVEIVQGPLIHGPEGSMGPGNFMGGSGSRSFYFNDPGWQPLGDLRRHDEGAQRRAVPPGGVCRRLQEVSLGPGLFGIDKAREETLHGQDVRHQPGRSRRHTGDRL